MVRSQTKIRKTQQANMLLEQRYLAKENHDTVQHEEDFDDDELENTPLEDEPSLFDDEEDDTIEDFGFDVEGDFGDDTDEESFDSNMKFKDTMKKNKFGGIGIGDGTRWDYESEKEYSPIKSTDLPLDKFLKSKYNKK